MKLAFALTLFMSIFGHLVAQTLPHDSWQKIQTTGSGTVTVLWHDSKPFHYIDDKGKHTGIDHDLMVALFDFLQKKYQVKINIQWHKAKDYAEFHNRVKNGSNGIFSVAAFSITPERKKVIQFSPTYMPDIEVIVSHPDMPTFPTIEALRAASAKQPFTALTVKNTTFDKNLKAFQEKYLPNLKLKYVTNADDIISESSKNPKHFAYIHLPIYALALKNGVNIKRQKLLQIQREGYAIMFPLKSDWKSVIDEFFKNPDFKPTLNQIIIRHVGSQVKDLIWNVSDKDNKEVALLTKENELQNLRLQQNALELERQRIYQIGLIAGVLVILILAGVIYSRYQIKRKGNQALLEKNTKIEKQKDKIESIHAELKDSITYAQQIQQAMMPHENRITQAFPDNFVIYKPKEILSGDFYWLNDMADLKVVAVADCAGRGVPGAFLTMMGTLVLNHIVRENKRTNPREALTLMDKLVHKTITSEEANLAIDISLCCINYQHNTLTFAGANSSLFLVNQGRLKEIKGNKYPVGKGQYNAKNPLEIHQFEFSKGDKVYLMTDGFHSQLGGDNEQPKKFMLLRLKDLLVEINPEPIEVQKDLLMKELGEWQGKENQTDDILLLGILKTKPN